MLWVGSLAVAPPAHRHSSSGFLPHKFEAFHLSCLSPSPVSAKHLKILFQGALRFAIYKHFVLHDISLDCISFESDSSTTPTKLGFSLLFFCSSSPTRNFGWSTDSPKLRLDEALGDEEEDEDKDKDYERNDTHVGHCRDGLAEDVKTILNIIHNSGRRASEIEYKLEKCNITTSSELVVEILSIIRNDWEVAFTFFLWAGKQPGYTHSIQEYHSMISILGKMRKFDIAWALIEEMRGGKSGPSLVTPRTLLIMIRQHCAVRDVGMALNTFCAYKQFNFQVGLEEFQSLLSSLCEYKNVLDAEHLFFRLKSVFPFNTKSFNIILDGWCNVIVSTFHAQRIWQEMSRRGIKYDAVSYACIMSCYSKAFKPVKVLKLFDQMKKMNITPNRKVYNAVIFALAKGRWVKEAVNLVRTMEDDGIVPTVSTYRLLIKALCKAHLIEEAKVILDKMAGKGLSPTIQTYHALFRVLRAKEEAFELWIKMREAGCEPTIETYIMLIRRFCQWRQLNVALKLWSEMKEYGFNPDRSSYAALIHGLFLNGKWEDAYKYYLEMREKGFLPEPKVEKMIQVWVSRRQQSEDPMAVLLRSHLGHNTVR
ncbi:pentatricopeptide repeat-containing protein At5g15010, mitochondrial-like [Neltuma alba]|uniref:pentatricopeptide repeat-containing protein At5g15010, mitochondrial-like n=1 Tax=Neltuma alba TaxID=207710 RepID=UPI0010A3DA36|nr:pentatricopeptide repeat-containing protein At5g15010, mitochondrial-like [Prosopis alba]